MVFLLFLSAFFSSSETALFSLRPQDLKAREDQPIARILTQLLQSPHRLLITILFCNMVVNLLFFSLSLSLESFVKDHYGPWGVGLLGALTIIGVIVFGEVTPKAIALIIPYPIASLAALPLKLIQQIFSPLVIFLEGLSHSLLESFGWAKKKPMDIQEIKEMMESERAREFLKPHEAEFIAEALDLELIQIKEVMIPRVQVISIDWDEANYEYIYSLMKEHRHSYYPVYRENIDNIVGILKGKECLLKGEKDFSLKEFLLPPFYISEYSNLSYGILFFKEKKVPMAIVVDEYGGFSGIVTLEDIMEEVFGEIQDEFDKPFEKVKRIHENLFIIPGNLSLRDLEELLEIPIDHTKVTTVSGWICSKLDRLPQRGDVVRCQSFEIEVIRTKEHRVTRALVRKIKDHV